MSNAVELGGNQAIRSDREQPNQPPSAHTNRERVRTVSVLGGLRGLIALWPSAALIVVGYFFFLAAGFVAVGFFAAAGLGAASSATC